MLIKDKIIENLTKYKGKFTNRNMQLNCFIVVINVLYLLKGFRNSNAIGFSLPKIIKMHKMIQNDILCHNRPSPTEKVWR